MIASLALQDGTTYVTLLHALAPDTVSLAILQVWYTASALQYKAQIVDSTHANER